MFDYIDEFLLFRYIGYKPPSFEQKVREKAHTSYTRSTTSTHDVAIEMASFGSENVSVQFFTIYMAQLSLYLSICERNTRSGHDLLIRSGGQNNQTFTAVSTQGGQNNILVQNGSHVSTNRSISVL